ncbi:Gfo/Idh/MocA family protein [Microlunatus speluncae]|uniref:Gfo/Idh/MocA family protein n=1 Tax=Microlunatus speluncae TaxID=2594267 RepID=UPI001266874F|nr:Gfo/Idh/MocA family oxidoreductase [Microlunatus speluncae]
MTKTVRAAVIGYGAMGRNHARVLASLPGVELVVIVKPSGDPSGSAPAPVVSSLTEALAYGLDLAVVASPTSNHAELGAALADASVPTMIEKPLAGTVGQARDLATVFAGRGVLGCVGHIERYNPATRALRQRLEQGELGEIFQVSTRRVGPFPSRIADVGVVLDLATHDIDLTSWATGRSFADVGARTAHRTGRPYEDLVSVSARLDDDTVTSHLISWLSPFRERCIVVTGERGAFVADTLTGQLTFHAPSGDRTIFAADRTEPLAAELEAFRQAVAGGAAADLVTLSEGARTVAVAEAILESARTGETVRLDPA